MTSLGKEFIGKLPPGADNDLQATMEDCKQLAKDGLIRGVQILPSSGCPISESQADRIYSVGKVPSLPLPGCTRAPCCGCDYKAVL